MKKYRIASVTVLYNPDQHLADNLFTYVNDVDRAYIVDNTETNSDDVQVWRDHPKIEYIKNPSNLGIAEALNIGAVHAREASCDFLLTMDQDSAFAPGQFQRLLGHLDAIDVRTVAIVSPLHRHPTAPPPPNEKETEVPFVMTSGNLLRLEAFIAVGPFLTALFIDHVDHEYCLRLRSHGYKIVVFNDTFLEHSLGEVKSFYIFKRRAFVSHSPLRTYYMIRNGLYVGRLYKALFPEFAKENFSLLVKELVKIFFEDRKRERLKMVRRALRDAKLGKMGKYIP